MATDEVGRVEWWVGKERLAISSGWEHTKSDFLPSDVSAILSFPDGHCEARWPESPDSWSYYVSLDAALVAAELRGYRRA